MKVDLHNHTKHSDGVYTSLELLNQAIHNEVSIFALTDHDSVFGCEEISDLAKNTDTFVIKGMELSTRFESEHVHIVCLFKKNIVPKEMIDFSYKTLSARKERAILMMKKIEEIYHLKMNVEELLETSEVITRANMLRNIAKYNYMSLEEASFYVSNQSLAYIPASKLSVQEGLAFAKKADCVTILAHPCLLKKETLLQIIPYGYDGIEVRYPSDKNNEEELKKLAQKYGCFISAGSDCHGDSTHADIGTASLSYEEALPIFEKLELKEEIEKWKLKRQIL